jgi:Sec-independent protein translocase protein TatA
MLLYPNCIRRFTFGDSLKTFTRRTNQEEQTKKNKPRRTNQEEQTKKNQPRRTNQEEQTKKSHSKTKTGSLCAREVQCLDIR